MNVVRVKQLSVEKPDHSKRRLVSDRKHMLVDSVNFDLKAGEILAIIGPNGAGKSTLIKALAGDIGHSGEAIITGLAETPIKRARQIAVLPQLSLLNFPYRVSEVVNLARIPHRSGWVRDQQVVDEALSLMDIKFLKDRFYTELSGGEKQRVQLARALAQIWDVSDAAHGTRLLLLDEPTTALDLGHQRDLMLAVQKFASQGVAVVMVLHDINLAARYADTMLALLCSEQIAYGSVEQVVTADNISRLFGIQAEIVKHPRSDTPVVIGI
jgi:iron complex transport system ATP-binding protein